MKKLLLLCMTLVVILSAVACSTKDTTNDKKDTKKQEITIKHKLGETKVPLNPKKVVVFDFGTLDTLDKLGVEVKGVPQSNVPPYLKKYKSSKYQNVGGLKEPDFEKVSEIAPDLIIISGRQTDSYKEFSKIAPTIYLGVDTTRYMESFKENATIIGKIFGKESEVKEELASIQENVDTLHKKTSVLHKKSLIILANDGSISAYGEGSRFGLIHDVFGFEAVDKHIKSSTHGNPVSFEYISKQNPDYLFVIDRGAVVGGESSAKTTVENELVKGTKAYKENHIVYLNPSYWYLSGGGLESVDEMIKEVSKILK